ncbi:hypothetical protein BLS_004328 [Venturia inaequalis]|uniref:Uncharacterized protein n=1 Tax=Venturia inaequalis TaxID=5025 RepID=A0A8H3UVS9_VENIN|nr:hypothetical protein BLS_004328 [Venturia inaequalis]KAE9976635.1 hypothetical protein EG328_002533 [Venturia inaequalis]KAE9993619.1 hypothetical protein EG327_004140 [Venturia inaequalis]RDI82066.1 hypothetical protein Vi05172_g7772 [Venturia inaequalis]
MWQQFIKTATSFRHDPPPSWSEVLEFIMWAPGAFFKWCLATVLCIVRTPGRKRKEKEERNLRRFLHETLEPQYWGRGQADEQGRTIDERVPIDETTPLLG